MIPFRDNIPARRYPVMTVTIIAVNVLAFFYELSLPTPLLQPFLATYGVVPAHVHPVSLLTSMFLHGGWLHLLGNMWFLWIFGDNVEDRMGAGRFLAFYLLCGFLGGLAHLVFNLGSNVPSIGASGAIAGVLGAYLISYPFARVLTIVPLLLFWPIIELPAILVLGFWFLIQLFNGAASVGVAAQMSAGVAWWAHIGGFIAGMLLLSSFAREPVRRYYWE